MNPQLAEEISKNFLEIRDEKQAKSAFENKRERLLKEIFEAHNSKQAELFTHLVNEGIRLLEANEEKQRERNMERIMARIAKEKARERQQQNKGE